MIDWAAAVTKPCVSVFGEPILYSPAAGSDITINGVFDDAYKEIDLVEGTGVPTESPVVGVALSDLPNPPKTGDRLIVVRTGETFKVKKVRPDGHGAVLLFLNSSVHR